MLVGVIAVGLVTNFHIIALLAGALIGWSGLRLLLDPVAAQEAETRRRRGDDDDGFEYNGFLQPKRSAIGTGSNQSASSSDGADTTRVTAGARGDSYDNSGSSGDSGGSSSSSDSGSSSSSSD